MPDCVIITFIWGSDIDNKFDPAGWTTLINFETDNHKKKLIVFFLFGFKQSQHVVFLSYS